MPNSYNGWSAAPGWTVKGGQLTPLVVRGEPFSPGVRSGDVHTVLQYVAVQLDARVERVDFGHSADDWGYNYRANTNNPSQLSCHASGTAFDYNATQHPNGKGGTWAASEAAEIRRILAEVDNVVKCLWGYDEMHFEIAGNAAAVARVAAKLRGAVSPSRPPVSGIQYEDFRKDVKDGSRVVKLGSAGDDVAMVQRWHGLEADGYFGSATEAAVKATQARNGLEADGIVGPRTWALMGVGAPVAPARKSVGQIAAEVIAGKWGNGPERERRIRAAGYDYDAVRAEVNRRI